MKKTTKGAIAVAAAVILWLGRTGHHWAALWASTRGGIQPIRVDPLPDHIAILVNTLSRCEELAVRGFLEGDPKLIYQSICFDPLTASVLSLQEIRDMTNAMFEKNKSYLTNFKSLKA